MDYKEIKALIDKYEAGETSLAEEQQLQEFFSQADLPEEFADLKWPFFYYVEERKVGTDKDYTQSIAEKPKVIAMRSPWLVAITVAAGLLLLIWWSVGKVEQSPMAKADLGTYEDPEEALLATKKALLLVSAKLNKGTKNLDQLSKFDEFKTQISKQSE